MRARVLFGYSAIMDTLVLAQAPFGTTLFNATGCIITIVLNVYSFQVTRKSPEKVSLLVEHSVQVINNNKSPASWTAEERKNPVIGSRQVQTFITMNMSVVKSRESGKVLSGGNFDFKDTVGTGYILKLTYRENDEAVKEITKWLRELNFSCIAGKTSASCFLADENADQSFVEKKIELVCIKLEENLNSKTPIG
jgi:hypothetical protein